MAFPQFRRTGVKVLQQLEDTLDRLYSFLSSKPHLDARIVKAQPLTSSPTRVAHGLGRSITGYIVIFRDADVRVWDSQAGELQPDKFVSLLSSAPVVVDLLVF